MSFQVGYPDRDWSVSCGLSYLSGVGCTVKEICSANGVFADRLGQIKRRVRVGSWYRRYVHSWTFPLTCLEITITSSKAERLPGHRALDIRHIARNDCKGGALVRSSCLFGPRN